MGVTKSAMKIHWRGTVGGITGSRQYGQDTWRSLPDSVYNPNTEGQQEYRARFAFISQLVAKLGYAYRLGYKAFIGDGRGPRALFSRQVGRDAVTGNHTDGYTVNYSKVLLSIGSLTNPYNITATAVAADHKVLVTWTDNSGVGDAEATDAVVLCIHNVTRGESITNYAFGVRADEGGEMVYPAAWAGDTLRVYMFMNGGDKGCSKSVENGPLTA